MEEDKDLVEVPFEPANQLRLRLCGYDGELARIIEELDESRIARASYLLGQLELHLLKDGQMMGEWLWDELQKRYSVTSDDEEE